MSVIVKYRCKCMDARQDLIVPERAAAVDVVMWLDDVVMPRIAKSHHDLNPECKETTMAETLLPAPPNGHIGGKQ